MKYYICLTHLLCTAVVAISYPTAVIIADDTMASNKMNRELVESLASRNRSPVIANRRVVADLPPAFDWTEQTRVWNVISEIIRHSEQAWPELVSHLDDTRYSITVTHSIFGSTYNWTVGDVCSIVVTVHTLA